MLKKINPIVLGCLGFVFPLLGSIGYENRGFNNLGLNPLNIIQEFTGEEKTLYAVHKNIRTKLLGQATYDYANSVVKDKPVPENVKELLRHVKSNEEIQDLKQDIIDGILSLSEYSDGNLSVLIKVRPMPPFLKDSFEKVTGEEIDRILDPMIQEGSVLESARLYIKHNVHLYKMPNQSDEKIKEDIVSFAKTFMTLEDALKEENEDNLPNRIVATQAELQNTEIINNFFKQHPDKILVLDMGDAQEIRENDFRKQLKTVKNLAVVGRNLTEIGDEAFEGCCSLQIIVIPHGVTSIGDHAFPRCNSLQSIVIPDSVTSIGKCAFSRCTNLKSIIIPDSVTSIGECAFSDCTNLKSIIIPYGVISIGDYTFMCCASLKSIIIPYGVISIGKNAFSCCCSLECLIILYGVTSIGDYAFCDCTSLKSIVIPDSVRSIGDYAFYGCISFQSIVIPDSVRSIGNEAFSGCWLFRNIAVRMWVYNDSPLAFLDSMVSR